MRSLLVNYQPRLWRNSRAAAAAIRWRKTAALKLTRRPAGPGGRRAERKEVLPSFPTHSLVSTWALCAWHLARSEEEKFMSCSLKCSWISLPPATFPRTRSPRAKKDGCKRERKEAKVRRSKSRGCGWRKEHQREREREKPFALARSHETTKGEVGRWIPRGASTTRPKSEHVHVISTSASFGRLPKDFSSPFSSFPLPSNLNKKKKDI